LSLYNLFCQHTICFADLSTNDSVAGRILKRNLVTALMWMDITALHVAASYLDPSLKSFSFVKDGKQRNLLEQVTQAARENGIHFNGILVSDESDTSDLEDMTATAESPDNEEDKI